MASENWTFPVILKYFNCFVKLHSWWFVGTCSAVLLFDFTWLLCSLLFYLIFEPVQCSETPNNYSYTLNYDYMGFLIYFVVLDILSWEMMPKCQSHTVKGEGDGDCYLWKLDRSADLPATHQTVLSFRFPGVDWKGKWRGKLRVVWGHLGLELELCCWLLLYARLSQMVWWWFLHGPRWAWLCSLGVQ